MPYHNDVVSRRRRVKTVSSETVVAPRRSRANKTSCQKPCGANTVSNQHENVLGQRRAKTTPCQGDTMSIRRCANTIFVNTTPCHHDVMSNTMSCHYDTVPTCRRAKTASCQDDTVLRRCPVKTASCETNARPKNNVVPRRRRVKTEPSQTKP